MITSSKAETSQCKGVLGRNCLVRGSRGAKRGNGAREEGAGGPVSFPGPLLQDPPRPTQEHTRLIC